MRCIKLSLALLVTGAVLMTGGSSLADSALCPVVSAGAETTGPVVSVQNLGQALIGVSANATVTMHAGVIPCYFACSSVVAPDLDRDCDVDTADFTLFLTCAGAAQVAHNGSPLCTTTDFDGDGDVDTDDFGIFQRCFSGSGHTPVGTCAN